MNIQLNGVAASQKEAHDKTKVQLLQYMNEIDIREVEINRIKKMMEQKDREYDHLNTQFNMSESRLAEIEEELEMKSGENNRLRKQVADLEKAVQDLYLSRKGNGSLQIELDSLKQDNERLIGLLKETTEYGDMDDLQIQNTALSKSLTVVGLGGMTSASKKSKSGKSSANVSDKGGSKSNDWIPTQAVRAILQIRDRYEGAMNERCISQILYELNSIWREIMRKENAAIKKRLNS